MNILIIDDEYSVLRNVKNHLERQKWKVEVADNYETAREKIFSQEFDVIVCDHLLSSEPDAKQGLDLVKEVREEGIQTPVIFLTGQKVDVIKPWIALNEGADDFVKKPWKAEELEARIKAIVRRTFACEQNATNIVKQGDISLNLDTKQLFIKDQEVHVGNVLFLLLTKFLQRPNVLLLYKDLITYVWHPSNSVHQDYKNTLRVHITHLKKILGREYARRIRTVHGEGYVWEV